MLWQAMQVKLPGANTPRIGLDSFNHIGASNLTVLELSVNSCLLARHSKIPFLWPEEEREVPVLITRPCVLS